MNRSSLLRYGLLAAGLLALGCQQQGSVFKEITPERSTQPNLTAVTTQDNPATPSAAVDLRSKQIDNPYDLFVYLNHLPSPGRDESSADFSARYKDALLSIRDIKFVNPDEHEQAQGNPEFSFGTLELQGLLVFLSSPYHEFVDQDEISYGGIGNCYSCHTPHTFNTTGSEVSLRRADLVALDKHLKFYQSKSVLAQQQNDQSPYQKMALSDTNVTALSAFIYALNQNTHPANKDVE